MTTTANGNGQAGLVNSATGAAGALAGWAIASIGKQLNSSEAHSSIAATAAPTLAPPAFPSTNGGSPSSTPNASPRLSFDNPASFGATSTASTSRMSSIGVKKAVKPTIKPASSTGMKLGGVKPKTQPSVADAVAGEWDDDGVENAWGTEDLIDVNADDDDWAAFESAPVPEIVVPPPQSYYVKPAQIASGNGPSAAVTSPPKAKPVKSPVPASTPHMSPKAIASPAPSITATMAKPSPVPSASASFDGWGEEEDRSATASPAMSSQQPSLANMSKEEKDKEMARRREERKAVSILFQICGV